MHPETANQMMAIINERDQLKAALTTAHIAMTIAAVLPGVDAEYDFNPAIKKAREALGLIPAGQPS